jgi:hypothetical protein
LDIFLVELDEWFKRVVGLEDEVRKISNSGAYSRIEKKRKSGPPLPDPAYGLHRSAAN